MALQQVILQDFIVKLLKSKDLVTGQEYNLIFITVDKLTKIEHFIPYTEEILAKGVAQVYTKEVFTQHRVPEKIISNRDMRFMLAFWQVFTAEQGVCTTVLTTEHP